MTTSQERGQMHSIIGEQDLWNNALTLLGAPDAILINIYGGPGTGKTLFLSRIAETLISRGDHAEYFTKQGGTNTIARLHPKGSPVFIADDVGKTFSKEEFKEAVQSCFSQNKRAKLVFASATQFLSDRLPGIQQANLEIGMRRFNYADFVSFLSDKNDGNSFPNNILKNFFLVSTYCKNFRLIENINAGLVDLKTQSRSGTLAPKQFVDLMRSESLQDELSKDLIIDYQSSDGGDYFFTIREKDKSEKLRDIIQKYYPDESLLREVMEYEFDPGYVEDLFSAEMSYPEKILNICFSYNPPDLIEKVLGPRDVICELNARGISEASFARTMGDKIKLLLRNIGLNILDEPKGVLYHIKHIEESESVIKTSHASLGYKEFLIGLGISCYQDLELVLFEWVSFLARYFFGSINGLSSGLGRLSARDINISRITFGGYIDLFRGLNKLSSDERYQLRYINLCNGQLIPEPILSLLEDLSSIRSSFSHKEQGAVSPSTLKKKLQHIYHVAKELMNNLNACRSFPEIIKIKEIKFDEFGRRLYVASSWDNHEIRFCMSSPTSSIDIYSYYYLLRGKQHIAINPIIIPRLTADNEELFAAAEDYQRFSLTQRQQGMRLIDEIDLAPGMKVLDVGCGNGVTTLELLGREPNITIDAFDIASNMIELCKDNMQKLGIAKGSVHFFVQDAETFSAENTYDLIFSNATLHWARDGRRMYKILYDALKKNGSIAVHQGGYGCYRGLHGLVHKAIVEAHLTDYFADWSYPIFYPKKEEMEQILRSIGFLSVRIVCVESDGMEYHTLVEDFINAGMLPYFRQLPEDRLRRKLRTAFLDIAKHDGVDKYSNRLYIFAEKGEMH